MKVTIERGIKPVAFTPFVLTLKVNTLEEAKALRSLYGGMTSVKARAIAVTAAYLPSTGEDVLDVCSAIGTECHDELTAQGFL